MSDEERNAGDRTGTAAVSVPTEQPDADEHTTVPNPPAVSEKKGPPADGKWQMPKPKFQQTSGYLPQGYLKDLKQAAAPENSGPEAGAANQEQAHAAAPPPSGDGPAPQAPPAIEPQPDLADQLIPEEPIDHNAKPQTKAGTGSSFPLIALGLIGLILFAAIFLVAVYLLYVRQPGEGGLF